MKRIITLVLTLAALLALTVTACADTIPGTAKLTITPTDTKVSGDTATVTYSVTVTPPEGKELGVFSVQLQPSDGMTLPRKFTVDGKKVITYGDGKLEYDEVEKTGYFATYEYTPQTGYFAAVGTTPERRMSKEATILTIQATMPANKSGTYTLNAEFIAALDGSGDVYTAQVSTTPVTVSGGDKAPVADKTPVITETDGSGNTTNTNDTTGAANNGTTPNGGTTTDGTAPNGTAPDGTTPDSTAPDGTAPDGATPNGGTNDTAPTGSSPVLWIVLAAALIAAAVIIIVVKKKKQ
mgnify:CR=1 FL=1